MGELVAAGGIIVDVSRLKDFENAIDTICRKESYDIPDSENIKWSPDKHSWLRDNLERGVRNALYRELLQCADEHDAKVIVAISDLKCKIANQKALDHEMDATLLVLERFDTWLGSGHGMVFLSKPSGGSKDQMKFIEECIEHRQNGTDYVKFDSFVSNPHIVPAKQSRILQVADLAVSITNAKVAGGDKYADALFEYVLKMMPETSRGVKGGLGLKIHPSFKYRNLYHWVLGDQYYVESSTGIPLPIESYPYSTEEMRWS
nr:hypothetical protein [Thalassorhabdomicrobium marinisediminis]